MIEPCKARCYPTQVNDLLIGLVSALVATNQPAAVSNLIERTTGVRVEVTDPNDPAEKEYLKLLADDDAAHLEVDKWIKENAKFELQGVGIPEAVLSLRIKHRFEPVGKAYEDFLQRNPKHVRARIAYGSFLGELNDEAAAAAQWEKALELDPNNAATCNNLANYYGHNGPVEKAFDLYEKAIALNPKEAVYYHNFGTTVFLFRKHVRLHYQLTEKEVFDKAMDLYAKALKLDPNNFPLATDVAKTYYGIEPKRTQDAKDAWNHALKLAADDIEREGVYLHLARWEIYSGQWDSARDYLGKVTNAMYLTTKTNVAKTLERKKEVAATNAVPTVLKP